MSETREGSLEAPPDTLTGRTIAGRYRIVGLLGQGGIGRVYIAEQLGMDRRVAFKVIRPERRSDPVTSARFFREARAAGRITSPNVVTLYDFGCDGDQQYIAMELLEGRSLQERLNDGRPMELSEVLHTAASIARGLRTAHEAGVLHRDLKPANVFLCKDGTVKVLDFGIAKLVDDTDEWEAPLTAVNRILGTPVYMSPEAATRRPLGPTSDLYALGLLIYEMIVGEPPFRTGDPIRTLKAQVSKPAPSLRKAAPWMAVPYELDTLVAALLRKNPSERPRDAGEVAEQLDRIAHLGHSPTTVRTGPSPEPPHVRVALPRECHQYSSLKDDDSQETEVWPGRCQRPRIHAPRVHAPRIHAPRIHAPRIHAPQLQQATLQTPVLRRRRHALWSAIAPKHVALAAVVASVCACAGMLTFRLLLG